MVYSMIGLPPRQVAVKLRVALALPGLASSRTGLLGTPLGLGVVAVKLRANSEVVPLAVLVAVALKTSPLQNGCVLTTLQAWPLRLLVLPRKATPSPWLPSPAPASAR